MTPHERVTLLKASVADPKSSRRYALRRTDAGLEFFEAKQTRMVNDEPEYHGHPTRRVPARVLRIFRDQSLISPAEYRQWTKKLG